MLLFVGVLLDALAGVVVGVLLTMFGCEPLMIEEMAAASAAVKLGSAVMAAVATLRVSDNEGCGGWAG